MEKDTERERATETDRHNQRDRDREIFMRNKETKKNAFVCEVLGQRSQSIGHITAKQ